MNEQEYADLGYVKASKHRTAVLRYLSGKEAIPFRDSRRDGESDLFRFSRLVGPSGEGFD